MKLFASALAIMFLAPNIGTAQNPAATPAPAKVSPSTPVQPTPEDIKALKQQLELLKLHVLAIETEENNFSQTDPVAKRAKQIWDDAMKSSPDVKKANDAAEADRKAISDKINAMKKAVGLDDSWDWNFESGRFYKRAPAQQNPAPPSAPSTKG